MAVRKQTDWRTKASELAELIPLDRIHPTVLAWTSATKLNPRWAVAFSGGADSLAALLLIWAHWPGQRRRLTALHFNHRLRGAASDRDQQFCEQVARALKIRCIVGRWTDARRDASEGEARRARHEFFGTQLKRLRTPVLWFGHQQDDIAETLLMRLARGSGTAGLAAPRPVQTVSGRVHLRPLLTISKSELTSLLSSLNIKWREDSTNRTAKFLRNRMRHDVISAWKKANAGRDALAGAALSRDLLDEDDVALDAWLDRLSPITNRGTLSLRKLNGVPRAVVRRALHRWIGSCGARVDLSRQAFAALLEDVVTRTARRHSFGSAHFAVIGRTELRLEDVRRKVSN